MAKRDIHYKTGHYIGNRRVYAETIENVIDTERKRKENANTKPNPDTVQRQEIHKTIKQMLLAGKGKLEILVYLSNTYPDTYLNKFFEQWIEYHIEKEDYRNDKSRELDDDGSR